MNNPPLGTTSQLPCLDFVRFLPLSWGSRLRWAPRGTWACCLPPLRCRSPEVEHHGDTLPGGPRCRPFEITRSRKRAPRQVLLVTSQGGRSPSQAGLRGESPHGMAFPTAAPHLILRSGDQLRLPRPHRSRSSRELASSKGSQELTPTRRRVILSPQTVTCARCVIS